MNKDAFNAVFRAYVRKELTPNESERRFVSRVYDSVQHVLGVNRSLQIGSYPRITSIRPLHDLDVLYPLGPWYPAQHDPSAALRTPQPRLHA